MMRSDVYMSAFALFRTLASLKLYSRGLRDIMFWRQVRDFVRRNISET